LRKIVIRPFVLNCFSYVSAKYYLNLFKAGKVITKNNKGKLFVETQCIRNMHTIVVNVFYSYNYM